MEEITEKYYLNNEEFMQKLIDTGDIKLIHKGDRGIDGFWGVNKNGNENHHAKILMKLRTKFSNMKTKPDVKEKDLIFTPKTLDEIESGLKIEWKSPDGDVLNGYIDEINKQMKNQVNITVYDEKINGEINLTVPLSDIKILK